MPIITEIDDRYIDVDFSIQPQFVFGDRGIPLFASAGLSYEERYGTLSDAEIDAEIEKIEAEGGGQERLISRIYNQLNEGSCVANACSQANEIVQAIQFGIENVVHLSAMSLYKRIGSGPNSGAMVSDGWAEMKSRGILPLDNPENRAKYGDMVMPNTGWKTPFPKDWGPTARLFAGVEATIITTYQGLKSAGVTPGPIVVGREGHSICYARIAKKNGRYLFPYPNSWGNWGAAYGHMPYGFGFDSESQIKKSASWAFKLRAVTA